jgi:predicted DNA-binding transcriptional regulator YafY
VAHFEPEYLEIVINGIAERKSITLVYKAVSEEISHRTLEPVGIFHANNYWYIVGYCLLRKDYRHFRTDRIMEIRPDQAKFTLKHPKLSEFLNRKVTIPRIKVRMLVDKKIAPFLLHTKKHYGYVSEIETAAGIEMTFLTVEIAEGFPRWYLSFADYMEVLEPLELKTNIKNLLERISNKLK